MFHVLKLRWLWDLFSWRYMKQNLNYNVACLREILMSFAIDFSRRKIWSGLTITFQHLLLTGQIETFFEHIFRFWSLTNVQLLWGCHLNTIQLYIDIALLPKFWSLFKMNLKCSNVFVQWLIGGSRAMPAMVPLRLGRGSHGDSLNFPCSPALLCTGFVNSD